MRVLFTTAPLRGHLFPLVPLAWAARAAGHEVLVATTEDFVPVVLRAGLPAVAWGAGVDVASAAAASGAPPHPPDRSGATLAAVFAALAAGCRAGARAVVRSWRPDLVVAERAEFAGPLAAAEAGLSWVSYHWGLSELPAYRRAAAAALGVDRLPEPALVVDPWPATMRLPHARDHADVRPVPYNGDALLSARDPVPDPAAPGRPRVCVTLGTVLPALGGHRAGPGLADLLAALGRLDVELDVVGIDPATAAAAGGAAVARAGHLSLAHVLPDCAVLVNHGGQGTALAALSAGCPQLVLPVLDDQFDTAEAIEQRGAGVALPMHEADPGAVADRCRALLDDPAAATAAAKVADEIAARPTPAALVPALENQVGR